MKGWLLPPSGHLHTHLRGHEPFNLLSSAKAMQDVQVAPHAVDVLAALVEGRPGERGVVRSCAEALCASGIAQPLLKLAAEMPHQAAGVKVTPEACG